MKRSRAVLCLWYYQDQKRINMHNYKYGSWPDSSKNTTIAATNYTLCTNMICLHFEEILRNMMIASRGISDWGKHENIIEIINEHTVQQ